MLSAAPAAIDSVRSFNRFYTRQLGLLERGLLGSDLNLTEARVIYELAQRGRATASDIARDLGLDLGYFSRLLRGLERRQLVDRRPDPADARRRWLTLSRRGRGQFTQLDEASAAQIAGTLEPLQAAQRGELLQAMRTIENLLGSATAPTVVLRDLQSGDIGWITRRQGQLYADEYGWDMTYEALVAEILAGFVQHYDAARERAWIAERNGAIVGSVFLVHVSAEVAKLRLLYVEPDARGLGLGRRLVDACVETARAYGYRTLTLWTQDILAAARRIYQTAGFQLVESTPTRRFGHELTSQTWSLELR